MGTFRASQCPHWVSRMMMFELPGELGFECYERQRDLAAAGMKVCEARAKAYYAVLGKEDPICPAGCFGRKV